MLLHWILHFGKKKKIFFIFRFCSRTTRNRQFHAKFVNFTRNLPSFNFFIYFFCSRTMRNRQFHAKSSISRKICPVSWVFILIFCSSLHQKITKIDRKPIFKLGVALVMCSISKESIMSDYIYLQSFIDLLNDKFIHVNIKGMNCYCNITLCLHCKQVECGQL